MWIWYFDRQGIIYSQGMSFVQDLPRFLVLLFAFQRFNLDDWGVIPIFNPNAKRAHQTAMDVTDASADHLRRSSRLKNDPKHQAANAREERKRKADKIDINLSELQQLKCFLPNLESIPWSTHGNH